MASIEVRPIPQPEPPREYVLTLDEEEALALALVLGRVGGMGRERILLSESHNHESVLSRLIQAGVPWTENFRAAGEFMTGHLYIEEH